ncbi:MAG: hypothetical protein DWQ37_01530 [Planctomycetota bacterium]|nr:MAG: hypothetical protein DWQ37_01530 [Planctomycetota bacterium]
MRYVRSLQAKRAPGSLRALHLESLEDRRLLDGTPWHNGVYRLDVNDDGRTSAADALAIINRILTEGGGELADPGGPVKNYYDTNADNRLGASDLIAVVNGLLQPPEVEVTMLTDYTVDVTPIVTVNAVGQGSATIPDGTIVTLDVDLDGNGTFTGPGELNYTQSETFAGSSTFQITPALERRTEVYTVNLRARLLDSDAVGGTSETVPMIVDTLTSDALANYVNTPDDSYGYTVALEQNQGAYTYYVLDMTSQTWRDATDVNKPDWRHWVKVVVPNGALGDTALLFITGGNNNFGSPPGPSTEMVQLALATNTVTVELRTVPSQSLEFVGDTYGPRSEDEIIAYSFDRFLAGIGEADNETWPVLVAMAKSAVRAMDTVQDFIPDVRPGETIEDFVVTGYSKRGWTTWLTGAVDDRVKAIIPGVFDNLNQGPQMVHHYGTLGFFSQAVHDYNDLQIFERILTPEALLLSRIVDPYRYLGTGKFDDMPILVLNSAGDEFFVTDSSQFYINDLPGTDKYMRYIPNTGHGLDQRAVESTLSFYVAVLLGAPLPEYSWTVEQNGEIHVNVGTSPSAVKLWQGTNPNARDFRNGYNPGLITWTSTILSDQGGGNYVGDVPMPADGATGYFIELTFPNPNPLLPAYVFTTEARVKSPLPFHPWPYESGFPQEADAFVDALAQAAAEALPALSDEALSAVATGLACVHEGESDSGETFEVSGELVAVDEAPAPLPEGSAAEPMTDSSLTSIDAADDAEVETALELDLNDLLA